MIFSFLSENMILFLLSGIVIATALLYAVYTRYPLHLIYKSKLDLQNMLDAVGDPLAVISNDYTVIRINKAYAKLINRQYKHSIGQKCYTVLRNRSTVCDDCQLEQTQTKQCSLFLQHSEHPSGSGAVSIRFTPFPVRSEKKNEYLIIEHIRDITALEKLKIDLERRNQTLANTTQKLRAANKSIREELNLARQIQQGLLPSKLPEIDRIKFDVIYKPISEVGGDIYDFIRISDTRIGLFIGDASGHGLSSALVGTISKMSLDNHMSPALTTSELLQRMNSDLCRNIHTSHYLTCFWCIFDFETNTLNYSRAGHPDPIVVRKNGDMETLSCNGSFLGIINDAEFQPASFQFKPGDRFYFFTDGIYDVVDKENRLHDVFGYDNFKKLIRQTADTPFSDIIGSIKKNLSAYDREDDYTLIIAEIC
ncbi:Serine phosphatase RsbU, regulator of sigma subunit [Chitinispirillum alkaliphilum]|nr:Serine phosphatase RsbU, regulator of sigma subunit [Chitinispirillum alkaliphilum]